MPRELILMSDIDKLGAEGQIVKVSEGYARNYLIPRKLAVPVSNHALKRIEKIKLEAEARKEKDLEAARSLSEKLRHASCTITVKVGENDRLFGSVHAKDIAEAISAQEIRIDRNSIQLEEPIHELGVYNVKIKLHPEVEATLKVWIVGE